MNSQRTVLYVPYNASAHGQWTLRRGSALVGTYATRADAMRQALQMAAAIRNQKGLDVELRVEDESGVWATVDQAPVIHPS
ncbi:hypothetical protein [Pinirhizobacter sp.]|jgi:hypothetical protein|uniref:hypothetical protein n=1 Tax=Pinirhizobacter sp. TaxID=2950432 RepID=UPI002F41C5E5